MPAVSVRFWPPSSVLLNAIPPSVPPPSVSIVTAAPSVTAPVMSTVPPFVPLSRSRLAFRLMVSAVKVTSPSVAPAPSVRALFRVMTSPAPPMPLMSRLARNAASSDVKMTVSFWALPMTCSVPVGLLTIMSSRLLFRKSMVNMPSAPPLSTNVTVSPVPSEDRSTTTLVAVVVTSVGSRPVKSTVRPSMSIRPLPLAAPGSAGVYVTVVAVPPRISSASLSVPPSPALNVMPPVGMASPDDRSIVSRSVWSLSPVTVMPVTESKGAELSSTSSPLPGVPSGSRRSCSVLPDRCTRKLSLALLSSAWASKLRAAVPAVRTTSLPSPPE